MIPCISNSAKSITRGILLGELTPAFPTSILTHSLSLSLSTFLIFTNTPDSPKIATSVSSLVALDPQKPLIWTDWTDPWPGPVYVKLQGIDSTFSRRLAAENCSSPSNSWFASLATTKPLSGWLLGVSWGFHSGHYWTRIVPIIAGRCWQCNRLCRSTIFFFLAHVLTLGNEAQPSGKQNVGMGDHSLRTLPWSLIFLPTKLQRFTEQ